MPPPTEEITGIRMPHYGFTFRTTCSCRLAHRTDSSSGEFQLIEPPFHVSGFRRGISSPVDKGVARGSVKLLDIAAAAELGVAVRR